MPNQSIDIPLDRLITLAQEHWRLTSALGDNRAPAIKHALRKIDDFLKVCELEIRVLDGQPYDVGLAARVVDTIDDRSLALQAVVIAETVSPMILYRGEVVQAADIVIARNPG